MNRQMPNQIQTRPNIPMRREAAIMDAIDSDSIVNGKPLAPMIPEGVQSKEEMLSALDESIKLNEEKLKALEAMDHEHVAEPTPAPEHEQEPEEEDEDEGVVVKISIHVAKKLAWMKRNLAKNASRLF